MRCYNGCPDDELKAIWDHNDKKTEELTKAHKDARCTYFPMEEKYQVFVGAKQVGSFCFNRTEAIDSAIHIIKETQ